MGQAETRRRVMGKGLSGGMPVAALAPVTAPRDKRKSVRKPVELRAEVELRSGRGIAVAGESRARLEVLLRDTSPGGFQFIVPGRAVSKAAALLARGSIVTLELELLPSQTRISIVGTIAWVSESEAKDQPVAIGVRAMPELADAATRRAFARWVALAT